MATAPVELAWRDETSVEVCEQLRNPETNDGFDLAELVDHVRTSEFVRYGFEPGAGRTPASGSVEELAQDLLIWGLRACLALRTDKRFGVGLTGCEFA